MNPVSRMPSVLGAPPYRGRNAPPGRIRSASMSGVLWSCPPDVGRISSTNSTKSRAMIRVDGRPRGHRPIEMERGVVLPDHGPGGFELPAEAPVSIRLEQVDDDRDPGRARGRGLAVQGLRTSASSEAQLLLRQAHPEPLDLRQPGHRLERPDGHPGLLVVVVGTEEPDAEASQRVLDLPVRRHPELEEPVHEGAALGAHPVGPGLQRGIEPGRRGEGARREGERARGLRGRLAPRVRLIPAAPEVAASASAARRSPEQRRLMASRPGAMWLRAGAGSGALPTAVISSATAAGRGRLGSRLGRARRRPVHDVARDLREDRGVVLRHGVLSSLPTGDTGPDTSSTATIAEATGPKRRQNSGRRRYRRACVNADLLGGTPTGRADPAGCRHTGVIRSTPRCLEDASMARCSSSLTLVVTHSMTTDMALPAVDHRGDEAGARPSSYEYALATLLQERACMFRCADREKIVNGHQERKAVSGELRGLDGSDMGR